MTSYPLHKPLTGAAFLDALDGGPAITTTPVKSNKLGYVRVPGVIDLSYSRRNTLRSCARLFLLREINDIRRERSSSTHTAYGHAFAAGVQSYMVDQDVELAYCAVLSQWDVDVSDSEPKSKKSLGFACFKLQQFIDQIYPQFFADRWIVARHADGRPMVELHYYVKIGDGYSNQGHIDLVLQSVETGELCVLEIKTGAQETHEADWKNSDQTTGYNVVLDGVAVIENLRNKYQVIYLHNFTSGLTPDDGESGYGFTIFHFPKSPAEKVSHINGLLLDVRQIQLYRDANFWPKNGNACRTFKRVCEFYGVCDLESMTNPARALEARVDADRVYETTALADVDYVFTMDELLAHSAEQQSGAEFNHMENYLDNFDDKAN